MCAHMLVRAYVRACVRTCVRAYVRAWARGYVRKVQYESIIYIIFNLASYFCAYVIACVKCVCAVARDLAKCTVF